MNASTDQARTDLPAAASPVPAGLLGAVLRTAWAGWWVFPVRPGGKTPAAPAAHPAGSAEGASCRGACGRWGHGLYDATTDPAVVAAMWARWPSANLGISCGPSGLVVIDLDTPTGPRPARVLRDQGDDEPTPAEVRDGASGLAWLCQRRQGRREDLDTLTVTTPTGGRHLYYRAQPRTRTRPRTRPRPGSGVGWRVTSGAGMTSGLGWGIDVRAWGGYVVAPPSIRSEGVYTSLGGVLRPLPGWLLDALGDAGRVEGRRPVNRPGREGGCRPMPQVIRGGGGLDGQRRYRYLSAAVEGELRRVWDAPAGELNDTVTRAAFALGQLVTSAGLDRGAAAEALLTAAWHAGSLHTTAGGKPFQEAKTTATIARALTAGAAHPRTDGQCPEPGFPGPGAVGQVSNVRELTRRVLPPAGPGWWEGCEAIPADYQVPDGYEVGRDGIWALREGKDGFERVPVTTGPVVVVAVYIDPDGNQLVELVWLDGHRWITRTVPRSVTKSGRKLVAQLGDAGFPATESDARAVERWLARSEMANRSRIPRHALARWLGWQPDATFTTSQDTPHRVEPLPPEQRPALTAHHPAGTLAAWQAAVARLAGYPVAVIVLSAAFAAPLLDVLGLDSFTIDISGRSTRGKTTAARLALSAWADSSERADGMFSWRTTMLAAEKRLNLVRGLPVVFDETRVVKYPELVDQVLYQVPKNHGAARGGGYPSLLPWRTIVISTGEQSALSFTAHQGAAARVLTIARPPFPASPDAGTDAAALTATVGEHYGTAGPAFVAPAPRRADRRPRGRDP